MVLGCNFCPFAARVVKENSIHFQVESGASLEICLQAVLNECIRLDANENIETSFIVFPETFKRFEDYLSLVSLSERLIKEEGYEGTYQIASFHPLYCFAGESPEDASNYTNRSVYPMLHLLREERIEQALLAHTDASGIPERNIRFAREKGTAYMKMLRDACYT